MALFEYGHLNIIIKTCVTSHFGEQVWSSIVKKCNCPSQFVHNKQYPDVTSQELIDAALEVTGQQRDVFLSRLGEFYLDHIRKLGHEELLRNLGENLLAFLQNLDYVHTYAMADYPSMDMPSFKCQADSTDDLITLHYYSFRQGYHHMVMGILKAVSKTYFKTDIHIEVLSKSVESVGKKSELVREHVIFAIIPLKDYIPPPTMVAQTRKAGERQILKNDVDHVIARLEEIIQTEGEEALPLNKAKAAKEQWAALARVSMLRGGCLPDFPKTVAISGKAFCTAFPYHMMFNSNMEVIHVGAKLQQIMPALRTQGCRMELFFDLLHPHSMAFNYENIKKFINTPFVLKARSIKMTRFRKNCPPLVLRGEMLDLESDNNAILYLSSPFVRSLADLEERKLHLADIPIHDVTRDMLWMELMSRHKAGSSHSRHQSSAVGTPTFTGRNKPIIVGGAAMSSGQGNDLDDLQLELNRTRAELEAEREKNRMLYKSFLPGTVADQILNGQKPDAGEYNNVSVLFCDIVAFTHIIARCKASDVVNLLTQLHHKFDQVCRTHVTDRVHAIGDAYLVMCGAPQPNRDHAEKIANTALGMKYVSRDVSSPFDYGDRTKSVKIRIGIHTGSVIGGIVGDHLPKYLVMGDTINMASKLESHGSPDQIQISEATYKLLKKKPFRIDKRGTIEMRGKGKVTTYILVANEQLRIDELTGQKSGQHDTVEVTFINDGREVQLPVSSQTSRSVSPLLPSNRVKPSNDVVVPGYLGPRR